METKFNLTKRDIEVLSGDYCKNLISELKMIKTQPIPNSITKGMIVRRIDDLRNESAVGIAIISKVSNGMVTFHDVCYILNNESMQVGEFKNNYRLVYDPSVED